MAKQPRKRKTKTIAETISALRDSARVADGVVTAIRNVQMEIEDILADLEDPLQKAESAVEFVEEKIAELEKR